MYNTILFKELSTKNITNKINAANQRQCYSITIPINSRILFIFLSSYPILNNFNGVFKK